MILKLMLHKHYRTLMPGSILICSPGSLVSVKYDASSRSVAIKYKLFSEYGDLKASNYLL
jgi:hypothetical protein